MKTSKLKIRANNPRQINSERFEKLKKSIAEFPKMMELRPIIYDPDTMEVLGGNMRLRAIRELSMTEIPDTWIRSAAELTEDERKRFTLADNIGFGEWDWDILANEWDDLPLDDWGLNLPVFDKDELTAEEDDFDIPDEIETDIVIGDLFQIGEHRLLCGDSTDSDQVARLMGGEKADLGLTDPPYNLGFKYETYKDDLSDKEYNDFIIAYVNNLIIYSEKQIITSGKQNVGYYYRNFDITEFAVWYAKNKMSGSKISNLGLCEPILFIGKFNRNARATDMFEFTVKQQKDTGGHTCPKVMDFFSDILKSYSDKLILDLFLGSGTTMVAAHQLKRRCYGSEIDPKYCQVIINRMKALDPDIEIKKL